MPHVTTHYRVIQAGDHHRQPRSANTWIEPNPPSETEAVAGSTITPYAPPHLAYVDSGGHDAEGSFVFWSATDGTDGQTSTNNTLNQAVGSTPMTLTAWYAPLGGGGDGPRFEFVDAFSDAVGDFVDDTFVTVTSDPSLTANANVVGEVPTAAAESLLAAGAIHTGETFEQWIGGNPDGDQDAIAKDSTGIAIATYQNHHLRVPNVGRYEQGMKILWGIVNDAQGAYLGPHGPVPYDPGWGRMIERVSAAAGVVALSAGTKGAAEITKVAMAEVTDAVGDLQAHAGAPRLAGGVDREG